MAKFQVILLAAALSLLAVSQAQQQRYSQRLSRGRSRYSARQELAPADAADPDAVTPYPSADELKPEVPFDEAAAPTAAEPTPDAVYGPPDAAPNSVPDEVYGPPDVTGNDLPAAADIPAEQQARLVAARRAANYRRVAKPVAYRRPLSAAARPAKLSAARSTLRRF
ncbi:uncharacterized protein LOC122617925 [Drosophila teissieri]|uniref:uncharacterized protein LOC122617925 n=1 Tax=Drosophila teissieri TaxID=7243 RepID=UPI001CB9DE21|nr:uncharacterized protein LOC122617925 [Drosophila teissieri]